MVELVGVVLAESASPTFVEVQLSLVHDDGWPLFFFLEIRSILGHTLASPSMSVSHCDVSVFHGGGIATERCQLHLASCVLPWPAIIVLQLISWILIHFAGLAL